MSTHKRLGPCPLCDEKILTGHPIIQEWWPKLKEAFPKMHVSWVYRNQADQDSFVALGKSRAMYPRSAHNKQSKQFKPCARAFDLFEIGDDNVPRWHADKFQQVATWLLHQGYPLREPWPISWVDHRGIRHYDFPHYELDQDMPQP